MSLMSLPHQFLPDVWDVDVASWEPLRYFGEGMRSLMYQDGSLWNCATIAAIVVGFVGVVAGLIAVAREKRYREMSKA